MLSFEALVCLLVWDVFHSPNPITALNTRNILSFYGGLLTLMRVLFDYIADKFGGLGSLLDVRAVSYCSVVEAGLSILLVWNLRCGREEKYHIVTVTQVRQELSSGGGDVRCSDSWPRPWRVEHQEERSSCCISTCPFPSRISLCTLSAARETNVRNAAMTKTPWCFRRAFPRRPYSADELLDLLAVGGVPGLGQGSEGATLHLLLAGLLVFALEMKMVIQICRMKHLHVTTPLTSMCYKDGRHTSDARLRTALAWRIWGVSCTVMYCPFAFSYLSLYFTWRTVW